MKSYHIMYWSNTYLLNSSLVPTFLFNLTQKDYLHNQLKTFDSVTFSTCKQEVVDLTDGCGGKFSVLIVSDRFEGKPLLAQHRMVNDCLVEELKTIHALTIKTMKPAQWEKQKAT